MSSPQKEHGHIQIASGSKENDVFGSLAKASLSGKEYQIVLWVIRKTWGFNKKFDWISLSQFERELGMTRSYLCRAINKLVTQKILVTQKTLGKTLYSFNKVFSQWVVTHKTPPTTSDAQVTTTSDAQVTAASDVEDNQLVTYKSHTKDNIQKTHLQKKVSKASPIDFSIAKELFAVLINNNPAFCQQYKSGKKGEAECKRWAEDIRLMREVDNREEDQVRAVVRWIGTPGGEFWQSNIMSGKKLRKQYNQLVGQMKTNNKKESKNKIAFISDQYGRPLNNDGSLSS